MQTFIKIVIFLAVALGAMAAIALPCWMIYLKEYVMFGAALVLDVLAFPQLKDLVKKLIN